MSTSLLCFLMVTGLVVVVIDVVQGTEGVSLLKEDPRYPGMCYDPDKNILMKVGTEKQGEGCVYYYCNHCGDFEECQNGTRPYELIEHWCSPQSPEPPCYDGDDKEKKTYPKCCEYPPC